MTSFLLFVRKSILLNTFNIGDRVRLLVQPFTRGKVEAIREGRYQAEVVVTGQKNQVIVGLINIRKERNHESSDLDRNINHVAD